MWETLVINSSSKQIESLLYDGRVKSIENQSLLSSYINHTSHRSDAPDRNPSLTIVYSVMNNFIRHTSIKNLNVPPFASNNIQSKLSYEVVVAEGDFEGVYGRAAKIACQQRVIVDLFSGLVATAYVSKSLWRK